MNTEELKKLPDAKTSEELEESSSLPVERRNNFNPLVLHMDGPHNIDPRELENSRNSLLKLMCSTPIIHGSHGYHPFQQRARVQQSPDNPGTNLKNPTIEQTHIIEQPDRQSRTYYI